MIFTFCNSRLQTMTPTEGGAKPSMFSVIRSTVTQYGFRSLYTGLSAAILRQMSYSLVRIGTYEKVKDALSANGHPAAGMLLLGAMTAGALGGLAGNPAGMRSFKNSISCLTIPPDIVLVRMTSDSVRPPETRYYYSNAISGLVRIVKDEGVKGLFRGLPANMVWLSLGRC